MYAGFYNLTTGAVYVQYIPNPVSMQAYSVVVPNSASQVYEPVCGHRPEQRWHRRSG